MKTNTWEVRLFYLWEVLWLAAAYWLIGKLAVRLAIPPGIATPVWPASGIALAALLLNGVRLWPGIWIGSFAVNLPTLLQHPLGAETTIAIATAAVIASGSTLQAVVGALLIRRWIRSPDPFDHTYDVLKFAGIEFACCVVAATLGVASLCFANFSSWRAFAELWSTFWLGDLLGVLVVSSLLLAWNRQPGVDWRLAQVVEGLLLIGALLLLGHAIFGGWLYLGGSQLPVAYLFLTFVVWAAVRFGVRGVTAAILLMATLAVVTTIDRRGPFVRETDNESLLTLQAFVGVMTLTGLFLAAALAETRSAEARFRLAVEAAPTGMLMVDQAGTIVLANSQVATLFGYAADEMLGRSIEILVPQGIRDLHPHYRADFLASPRARAMGGGRTLHGRHRNGDNIPVEIGLNPLAVNNQFYVLASVIDISQRKKVEAAIERAKMEAEAASRVKSDFLANVSHEIRTPLNGILGLVNLLADSDMAPKQREYTRLMRIAADSLLAVINNVLDFAKVDAGKLSLKPVPFRLRDCLHRTLKTLAPRAHKRGLEFLCLVEPDVPDALVGDHHRLCQVLVNLVSNAVKFTHHGEVVVRVDQIGGPPTDQPKLRRAKPVVLDHAPPTVQLHFAVSDTGIGIPQEKRQTIFQPFEQADTSARRKYEGTGLGLAIASQLCALMGGRIWVESTPGSGSTFHFTAQFDSHQVSESASPVNLRELPVLIVDDNATSRRQLEGWLQEWAAKPTAVAGAAEAVTALTQRPASGARFELLLLDAHLRDMDGLTFMETVRRENLWAGKTILLRSTTDGPEKAFRSAELGIDTSLSKPLSAVELLDAMRRLFGRGDREVPTQIGGDTGSARGTAAGARAELFPDGLAAEPAPPRSRHILVVEDNPISQHLMRDLLEKAGQTVTVAGNGEQALALLGRDCFDVMLLDVQMPGMSGLEVSSHVREREKINGGHLPIVALTAHAMHGDRERCLEAGMDDYVAKPIHFPDLWAAIDRLVPGWTAAGVPREPAAPGPNGTATGNDDAAVAPPTPLAAKMARIFLEVCPQWRQTLQRAIADGDARMVEVTGHTLKGSAGHFAAEEVVAAAFQLELLGRSRDLTGAEAAFAVLDEALQLLQTRLGAWVADRSATKPKTSPTNAQPD